jgi:N-methylhydantoinase A/oxoprolinase/acetone carboxylase beta subunit
MRPGRNDLPIFKLENLKAGDWFEGPCLVEEEFFTTHVKKGWRFSISDNGDVFLRR